MSKSHLFFALLLTLLASTLGIRAQEKPFWNEIRNFQRLDSIAEPSKHAIVFVGSSSVRMWDTLEAQYKSYPVINRGFGGSDLVQANAYINELVLKYQPRQVVIYSGENDIAAGASGEETYKRFVTFYNNLRQQLPQVPIEYVSIKMSPSRMKYAKEVVIANKLIRKHLKNAANSHFIEVNAPMLDKQGKPRPELFKEDMLHMKPEGYAIWTKQITPYLKKN